MKDKLLLIGLPGSGKSTIAKILSETLSLPYIDMDTHIGEITGKTIPELFEISEDHFRDMETKSCEILTKLDYPLIIASGGGIVKRPENIEAFRDRAVIIFIYRPVEHILGSIDTSYRPLIKDNSERLYKLHEERYELYKNYSDFQVNNIKDIHEVIREIQEIAQTHININKEARK